CHSNADKSTEALAWIPATPMRRLLLHYNVVISRARQRARDVSAALCSTKFENAKTNGLVTVAAWVNYFTRVPGKLADARHHCRRSTGYYVSTGWHRVRRRIGRTRYLWSLRDHRPTSGLCPFRAQSHTGSWTRLRASCDHTWRCFSAIRRQRPSRRSSGWHDGGRLRPRVYCGGGLAALASLPNIFPSPPPSLYGRD